MEKRWLFSVFYLVVVPSVAGQLEDVITQAEVVHALPGTDVTLVCSFPRSDHIYVTQMQWSKADGNQLTTIAVYHPIYGVQYFKFPETSYNFSVSFSIGNCCNSDAKDALCSPGSNTFPECSRCALQLKNISVSLSGQYECSLATYPFGTKAGRIQLIVEAEEEQHYVKEVQLNQTLEIPCLGNVTSEDLSNYPLKWLVGENGSKEELVTKEPPSPEVYRNGSALYRERIHLGLNNALKIFATKLSDDGKVFSCHVVYHPERTRKTSTTVRVLAYPEISVTLQEGSVGTLQKPNVSCVVRKAFPKPSLVWYVDRQILTDQSEEMSVEQEDSQDSEGFYQLQSTLMLHGTPQIHKIFSCACLFSFLRNETWNIPSEEIFFSFDNESNEVSTQAFSTMASQDLGNSALPSTIMTTSEHQSVSLASLDFTSQASLAPATTTEGEMIFTPETKNHTSTTAFNRSLTTAYWNDSTTVSLQSLENATRSLENTSLAHRNLSFSVTDHAILVTRWKEFYTTDNLVNSTGSGRNVKAHPFPWPTAVAVLLLFCSFLIVLGIRKWCQYQKEIMNRPPSFKPPPPPIKYTSMVESDGTPPSCHELESL
ncbi:T-cell surface protein tactile [Dromaius novaehollandiae]|uniref:T-cell surface protein tactile n=1 Tax=Dromaius novaehollandiae TaxID=8790 RepID=UPI00311D642D